jgi:hypothetical protein
MQQEEFERETLLRQQREKFNDQRSKDPPPLKEPTRPYKGMFLTFFLWFTGMLFFVHGFHRFEEYSWMDLAAVWVLSSLCKSSIT